MGVPLDHPFWGTPICGNPHGTPRLIHRRTLGRPTVNKRYSTAMNHPGMVSESKTKFSIRMNLQQTSVEKRGSERMDKLLNKPRGVYKYIYI